MRVILQEKIANLGNVGDQVMVKRGYGRNYLIPKDKAVLATQENVTAFEKRRVELEKTAADALSEAQERAKRFASVVVKIEAQAGEEGKLFGSIGPRDIAEAMVAMGYEISKSEIAMPEGPFRHVGEYEVMISLHSEVHTPIKIEIVAAEAE